MIRWWDDPSLAEQVLAGVDDRDVVQGVGTAVLGYHALAKAALSPLASSTLVDPAQVASALDGVDLGPVSKALAAATEPVMGSAASAYGDMAARELHERAVEGAQHLMAQMGSVGLPMPFAVERVAEVVGVPARDLGEYSRVAKAPVVAPLVRMDAADRALMAYASRRGALEVADGSPSRPDLAQGEVSKAPRVRFREDEHPRDSDGQFAYKQVGPDTEAQERKERKERRQRRALRGLAELAADARAKSEALASARSLDELAAALQVREPRARAEREVAVRPEREVRARGGREVRAREPEALPFDRAEPAVSAPPKAKMPAWAEKLVSPATAAVPQSVIVTEAPPTFEQVFVVPVQTAAQVLRAGGFTMEHLCELAGMGAVAHTFGTQSSWNEARDHGLTMGETVAIRLKGPIPIVEGSTPGDGVEIANAAQFRVLGRALDSMVLPSMKEMEVIDVVLGNRDDFPEGMSHEPNWRPLGKAVERWRVRGREQLVAVERDEEGQFAEHGHGASRVEPDRERRERQARRARRARRMARRPVAVSTQPGELALPADRRVQAREGREVQARGEREVRARERRVGERGAVDRRAEAAPRKDVAAANALARRALLMSVGEFDMMAGEGPGLAQIVAQGRPVLLPAGHDRLTVTSTVSAGHTPEHAMKQYVSGDRTNYFMDYGRLADDESDAAEMALGWQDELRERGGVDVLHAHAVHTQHGWVPEVAVRSRFAVQAEQPRLRVVPPPANPDGVALEGSAAAMRALRNNEPVVLTPRETTVGEYLAERAKVTGVKPSGVLAAGSDLPLVVLEVSKPDDGR